MILEAGKLLRLELLDERHAEALLYLRNTNYTRLRTWLSWVDGMQTLTAFQNYIFHCRQRYEAGLEVPFAIVVNGEVAGRIGLNYIDANKTAAIGYWLGEAFEGKGIITQACRAVIAHGFTAVGLNRIEIKCAVANDRSGAVAERLGFTREGILRQAEWINGTFTDLYLYALLQDEWKLPAA